MFTQKLRLTATSLFLFVGLTTTLFGTMPTQTVFAQDNEPEAGLNAADQEDSSCEALSGPLGWIGCGVLGLLDGALSWLDGAIKRLLFVESGVTEGVREPWAVFRNLAYIVLVPMMLLMVIGTAINMGPFDPYTVKKALPRMFVAVVFIALSFPICEFLINLSNVVGNGVGNLLLGANGSQDLTLNGIAGYGTNNLAGGILLGLVATIGGAATLGTSSGPVLGILGSFGLILLIGLLLGFLVLVIRQVLIVVLIVFAPLAILAWIFPGNDKLWGIWKTTFTAMLFMYPLIAVLIAAGKFFADITLDTNSGGGLGAIIALLAYITPYFLIPATFKYGLGVFGNLAGMINDRGRGFFDRQRKRRAERYGQLGQQFKTGDSRNAFVSRMGRGVGVGLQGRYGFGQRGQKAMATLDQINQAEAAKNPRAQALGLNDDEGNAVMALSGGTHAGALAASHDLAAGWRRAAIARNNGAPIAQDEENRIEARRMRALAGAQGAGISRNAALAAGQTMMQNKARAVEAGDWGTIQRGINRLHGDNAEAAADYSQTLRYLAMEGGRSEFASTGDMVTGADGQLAAQSVIAGFDRTGAGKVAAGHVSGLRAQSDALLQTYQAAVAAGDEDGAFEAAHRMTALRNAESAGYTPEENKGIIDGMLRAAGIDTGSSLDTADQFGELITRGLNGGPLTQQQARVDAPRLAERVRTRAALFERGTDPRQAASNNPSGGGNPQNQSDARLKTNINYIATTSVGIKLYSFNYLWDPVTTYVGVMAQDLLGTNHESAVWQQNIDGYYRVDYQILGLRMLTLEQWQKNPDSIYLEKTHIAQ